MLQTFAKRYFLVGPAVNMLPSNVGQGIRCARGDPSSCVSGVLFCGSSELFRLDLDLYGGVLRQSELCAPSDGVS